MQAARSIHHAFTVGRVRFILSDLRSARTPVRGSNPEQRTLMGAEQLAWFKAELLRSSADHVLLVWVCEFPWVIGDRKWGWFEAERQQLLSFIVSHGLRHKMLILSGDAHMLAIDDGRFSPGGIPVLHASPLDRMASYKGGPYAYGAVAVDAKGGQGGYGLLTITDQGVDVSRTHSPHDLTSLQDRVDLERKSRKRASLTQRAATKLGLGDETHLQGDAEALKPPAYAGRLALQTAAGEAGAGKVLPVSRLASWGFQAAGLDTSAPVATATAALAAAAGSADAASRIAELGGVSHHLEGGGNRPSHVATATAWTGVCITARGIVSDGTAVRDPAARADPLSAVTHGSPLSMAGEVLRWDTCRPQTSSQVAPHYPALTKPGEWAPYYAYRPRECSVGECDVDGKLPAGHPLGGIACPQHCYQAERAGSTFSGWEIKQAVDASKGAFAAAAVVEQQHLITAASWASHWLLTPLSAVMSYVLAPMHTYSKQNRFMHDNSVAWLGAYYGQTRQLIKARGGGTSGSQAAELKLALPWLAQPGMLRKELRFISLRDLAPDSLSSRVSLGFYDLHSAAFQSLRGSAGISELLQKFLHVTRSATQAKGASAKWLMQQYQDADLDARFTNATYVSSDHRRLEALPHATWGRFRMRAAAVLDAWAASDPKSAASTFTIIFMGSVLLLFVAVQGLAGLCAIEVLPRLCCGRRAAVAGAGEEAESAEAAAYNEWYRKQQALSEQQRAAAYAAVQQDGMRQRASLEAASADSTADHTVRKAVAPKLKRTNGGGKKRK